MTFNPICSSFGGRKNTVKRLSCLLTLPRGSPSSISLLVPGMGSLVGSQSSLLAVTIPSPVHLFSKGSGHIPRHHLPGGGGGGGGKCSNIRRFLNRERAGCGKIEMCFFSNLRTNLIVIILPCINAAQQQPKAQQNLSHLKILDCVASSLLISAVPHVSNNEYGPYLKWADC